MDKFAREIKRALDASGQRQAAVAEASGVTPGFVSQWATGKRPVPADKAVPLARIIGTSPELVSEAFLKIADEMANFSKSHVVSRDEIHPEYVRFPLLEGYAGMGPGTFISDYPEVVQELRVSREWVNQKMPGVPHDAIRVITGRGDSMKGQYSDGDLIFVDTRVKTFDQDSAYCFRWEGRVQVKRLQYVGRSTLRMISDNPKYPPIDADIADIEIGGRAIAAWTLSEF